MFSRKNVFTLLAICLCGLLAYAYHLAYHLESSVDVQNSASQLEDSELELSPPLAEERPVVESADHSLLAIDPKSTPESTQRQGSIASLCQEVGAKLGSVKEEDCTVHQLQDVGAYSVEGRSLALKEYLPTKGQPSMGKVLLMGGIHGDEFSSVTIMFRWMNLLMQQDDSPFHWQVVPLLNPDGLLRAKSQRQNSKSIDLNRNFPTPHWTERAPHYWKKRTYENPRHYPGEEPASEPETQWFISLIDQFQPDVIVVVHAPHKLVDFDGPYQAPEQLGSLRLRQLGVYPGSLGNYAGVHLGISVVTVELAYAGIMPPQDEIETMWSDLAVWLGKEMPKQLAVNAE